MLSRFRLRLPCIQGLGLRFVSGRRPCLWRYPCLQLSHILDVCSVASDCVCLASKALGCVLFPAEGLVCGVILAFSSVTYLMYAQSLQTASALHPRPWAAFCFRPKALSAALSLPSAQSHT